MKGLISSLFTTLFFVYFQHSVPTDTIRPKKVFLSLVCEVYETDLLNAADEMLYLNGFANINQSKHLKQKRQL